MALMVVNELRVSIVVFDKGLKFMCVVFPAGLTLSLTSMLHH